MQFKIYIFLFEIFKNVLIFQFLLKFNFFHLVLHIFFYCFWLFWGKFFIFMFLKTILFQLTIVCHRTILFDYFLHDCFNFYLLGVMRVIVFLQKILIFSIPLVFWFFFEDLMQNFNILNILLMGVSEVILAFFVIFEYYILNIFQVMTTVFVNKFEAAL